MWHNINIRTQLVILFSLLITIVQLGTFPIAYWFDIKERKALAIGQTQTLSRALNHDLLKALLNQHADAYSDISFRLSAFDSLSSLALLDNNDRMVYQYQHQRDRQSKLDIAGIDSEPRFTEDFLFLRQPLQADGHVFGSVIFKIDHSKYSTQLDEHLFILLLLFSIELIVGIALASWISRAYTKPFTELANAMKSSDVRNNDYRYVTTKAQNEIADLYNGYNQLIQQIEITTDGMKQAINHKEQSDVANKAKSAFLANMSHELRTPLNAIIGYSEIIRDESIESNQTALIKDSENIITAGKHLLSLIDDVLDLSKIESGKMDIHLETVSVKCLLHDLTSTFGPLSDRKGNQLTVSVSNDLNMITTDLTKLRQILINLVNNANKFTDHGEVNIKVWSAEKNGEDWCYFNIQDTGIGMTSETMKKLFTPFTQADSSTTRNFGGTGLGLAISKRFCEMLGGSISVESNLGEGTSFTVGLPVRNTHVADLTITKRKAS